MSRRIKKTGFNPRKNAREQLQKLMGEIFYVQDMFIIESGKLAHALDELAAEDTRKGDLKTYADHQIALAKAGFLGLIDNIKTEVNKIIVEADTIGTPLLTRLETEKWDNVKDAVLPVDLRLSELSADATIAGQKYTGIALELMENYFRNVEFVKRDLESGSTLAAAEANLKRHIDAEAEKAANDALNEQAKEQAANAVRFNGKGEKITLSHEQAAVFAGEITKATQEQPGGTITVEL